MTPIFLAFNAYKASLSPQWPLPHPLNSRKVPGLPVCIWVSPLIYTLKGPSSSLPVPTIFRTDSPSPGGVWGNQSRNRKKPPELLFIFVFFTWIGNQHLVLFDIQMEVVLSVVCMTGGHVSLKFQARSRRQRQKVADALIHALVFCVLWHCSSHVPNLVDLWIILSGFNYTNPWKTARWLKQKFLRNLHGSKVTLIMKAQSKEQEVRADMFFCLLIHLPVEKQGKINNPDTSQTNKAHYWESYSHSTDLHVHVTPSWFTRLFKIFRYFPHLF